jgi:hypothetical protein
MWTIEWDRKAPATWHAGGHHRIETFSYDKGGRMTKDSERGLVRNAKGRLAKVTPGEAVEEFICAATRPNLSQRPKRTENRTALPVASGVAAAACGLSPLGAS